MTGRAGTGQVGKLLTMFLVSAHLKPREMHLAVSGIRVITAEEERALFDTRGPGLRNVLGLDSRNNNMLRNNIAQGNSLEHQYARAAT